MKEKSSPESGYVVVSSNSHPISRAIELPSNKSYHFRCMCFNSIGGSLYSESKGKKYVLLYIYLALFNL